MDRGDFFAHFVDGSEDMLEKASEQVSKEKLDSYLELAIRTSSVRSDPYKDDVSCTLNKYGISEQLFVTRVTSGQAFGGKKGQKLDQQHLNNLGQQSRTMKVYESLTLDYKVQWPLTLVISKKALNKYQLIFRHLLFQKYVETCLEKAWGIHQSTKECNIQALFHQTYRTRHKMLQFCKNYLYYMLYEVLEPNFNNFKESLKNVKTIDEIIQLHDNFLDKCLNECLLTNQKIHGIINHINLRSHFFSRVIVRFFSNSASEGDQADIDYFLREDQHIINQFGLTRDEENNTHLVDAIARRKQRILLESKNIEKSIVENNYYRMVDRFEKYFDNYLKELMQLLTEQVKSEKHIANLVMRLDYNEFYSRHFEEEFN